MNQQAFPATRHFKTKVNQNWKGYFTRTNKTFSQQNIESWAGIINILQRPVSSNLFLLNVIVGVTGKFSI